jgi:hypothetical protein
MPVVHVNRRISCRPLVGGEVEDGVGIGVGGNDYSDGVGNKCDGPKRIGMDLATSSLPYFEAKE